MNTSSRTVAIVGAGPAGIYAADALAESGRVSAVDVFDRLPAPYGLVRYGVAPDHPKIKSITGTFAHAMENPVIRYLGNVEYGRDITWTDLRRHYDAVVFSTGAPEDQRLGVPGEDLAGSVSATEFVAWYNGHPDIADDRFVLDDSITSVAVVGAGNVALDVARILAKEPGSLTATDVPQGVLAALNGSRVTDVHVIARRGPADTRFTTLELRELGELPGVRLVLDPADFPPADDDAGLAAASEQPRRVLANLKTMRQWVERPDQGQPRRIHLHFYARPAEILGTGLGTDHVAALRAERNRPIGGGAVVGTGEFRTLPVDIVVRAVGYRSVALAGLPFDARRRIVPSEAGRVLDDAGRPVPRAYVAGWLRRGPTGIIGTNKADAAEVVRSLLADLPTDSLTDFPTDFPTDSPTATATDPDDQADRDPDAVPALLRARGVAYVTWPDWRRLDAYEAGLGAGSPDGRGRIKVRSIATMLDVCHAR